MDLRVEAVGSPKAACAQLIAWLATLPADLTRQAVVLLPSEDVAHALRRRVCCEEQRPGLLTGVRLLQPAVFAREVLSRAGLPALPGGAAVRRLRMLELLRAGALPLRYFRPEQLRAGRGYGDAFMRAVTDLENSNVSPVMVQAVADELFAGDPLAANRLRDVATLWAAAQDGVSLRAAEGQVLQDAAKAIRADVGLLASFGAIAALIANEPTAALVCFLAAINGDRTLFIDALPLRTETQRWRPSATWLPGGAAPNATIAADDETLGPLFAAAVRRKQSRTMPTPAAMNEGPPTNELQLLQHFLFAPPERLADPARPQSIGSDDTVVLEEHQSIEEEVEAAAAWVAEEVRRGVPAEEIALIIPDANLYVRLIVDRLSRIGTTDGSSDTSGVVAYVAGGLPIAETPAGVRLLNLLRAWRRALEAETTIHILPALRRTHSDGAPRLTPSAAAALVYGAGIVGGSPGDSSGAREWLPRFEKRCQSLRRIVEESKTTGVDEPEKQRHRWEREEAVRALAMLEVLMPAIGALQAVGERIRSEAPLTAVWPDIRRFVDEWFRIVPDPPNLMALLDERLAPILAEPAAERVTGWSAVDYLIDVLGRERLPHGRFGEPRVFVGSTDAAAGLSFTAVRILGLAEGVLPRTPHDDPIVPNDLRRSIEQRVRGRAPDVVLSRIEDRVLEDLHGFYRVVAACTGRLRLSAPRQWVDRSEREVSGAMLEVAAALSRPPATGGAGVEPSVGRLRADYFAPAVVARHSFTADQLPLLRSAMPELVQRHRERWLVPASWCREIATDLDRVHALMAALDAESLSPMDGMVGSMPDADAVPGLTAERPISASALTTLWRCPYRFLLERLLGFRAPAQRPATDHIDPLAYGSLFHTVAEVFFREVGEAICTRRGDLPKWIDRARAIASVEFDRLQDEYPLRGGEAIERERQRLLRQIEQLVRYEWEIDCRTFVATELRFGQPEPLRLDLPGGPLFVRGTIDRVDRNGRELSVRDLKTGRVSDFGEEPIGPIRDLQIGLYGLVLDADARVNGRVSSAAYVHPSEAQEPERAFRGAHLRTLRERSREWLTTARGLLEGGLFPRTPNPEDCRFCPFVPVCGEGAQAHSAAKLRDAELPPALNSFLWTKLSPMPEE